MEAELVFIQNYPCPRCHVLLEGRTGGLPTWLRCPRCGRACLPPERLKMDPPPFYESKAPSIGTFTTGPGSLPIQPRSMAPMPQAYMARKSNTRLLLGTGFFLTSIICLFSLLDSNGPRAGISGFAAMIFLFLLSRRPGRPADESPLDQP